MASRRRGYRSRRLQAFQDDPKLLIIGPAPPSAGLNDLKPLNLSTVLMAVHKHCYTSLNLTNKAAAPEGDHQTARDTTEGDSKPLGSRGAMMADRVGKAQD